MNNGFRQSPAISRRTIHIKMNDELMCIGFCR